MANKKSKPEIKFEDSVGKLDSATLMHEGVGDSPCNE